MSGLYPPTTIFPNRIFSRLKKNTLKLLMVLMVSFLANHVSLSQEQKKADEPVKQEINEGSKARLLEEKKAQDLKNEEGIKTGRSLPDTIGYQVYSDNQGGYWFKITYGKKEILSQYVSPIADDPAANKAEAERRARLALNVYKQHPDFSQQELQSEIIYQLGLLNSVNSIEPNFNTLANCVYTGTVQTGDPQIVGDRIFRDAPASSCAAPQTCTGSNSGTYNYDTHNFTNTTGSTQCVTIAASVVSGGTQIHATAYLGSFVATNICQNYLADQGTSSTAGNPISFSLNVLAGQTVVIVVYNPVAGTTTTGYSITVTNCPVPSCFPITITGHPANQSVCPGTNTSFTVAATPAGVSYNWQEDRGSGFVYLSNGGVYSGVTTATLNLTGVTASMNGYKYRAVVTCPDGGLPQISNEATLTVLPAPPAPAVSPFSATICPGGVVALNVISSQSATAVTSSSGPISVAIPDNSAVGATHSLNVAGFPATPVFSISVNFNITHTFDGDLDINLRAPNGNILNLVNNRGGAGDNFINTTITSNPAGPISQGTAQFTGTFAPDGTLNQGPTGYISNVTVFSSLFSIPNGTWTLAIRDGFGQDIGTLTSWSITITAGGPPDAAVWSPATGLFNDAGLTSPYVAGTFQTTVYASPASTTTYSARITNGTCQSATTNVTVTVNQPPVITTQPSGANTCVEAIKTFTVAATGSSLTYQWQVNTGSGFVNVTNTGVYSGATTATLTLTGVPASFNGYIYRVIVSGACPSPQTSNAITLIVNPLPTVAVGPANQCSPVTLTATGADTYSWSPPTSLSATTGATVTSTATANTTYTVTGTITATGCSSKAQVLVIGTPRAPNITPPAATICLGSSQLLQVSGVANFSNPASITINDAAPATPYPSNLAVSGLPTSGITVKSVTINGFSHTFPDDVDILLQSPTGINVVLMSDAGGGADAVGAVWTFDDAAATTMADGALNANGTYKCTNYGATDTWVAPGPGSVTQASPSLSLFGGNFNGTWKLFVVDAFGADIGSISGGWSISFNTGASTVNFTPLTGLFNDAGLTSAYTGNAVTQVYASPAVTTTYTVTASSTGPASNSSFSYSGGVITINDSGPGTPYPATIAVTGIPATGVNVKSITLNGLTHTFPGDLDILVRSPSGQNVILMSDVGGAGDLNNVTYTFSGTGSTTLSGVYNPSGTYLPTNVGTPDTWIAPGPGSVSQANPSLTTFTGDPNGTWNLFIVDDAGGDIGTLTGWTITFDVGTTTCTSPPTTVTVTVHNPIVFTQHPQNRTACQGDDVTFTVAATGTVQTYQWQQSINAGATWTNIAGATSATLTLTTVQLSMSGYRYRAVLSSVGCGNSFSNAAILTVNPLPTVTLNVSPAGQTQLQPGMLTTLTVSSTPAAVSYIWYRDGVVFTPATGASYVFDAFTLGTYAVEVVDVNGCRNTSNAVTLTALPSSNLFIFPNPNTGQFSVTYFTPQLNWPVTMNVIDMKGSKLIERSEITTAPYTRYLFDLSKNGAGVYIIEFRDPSGNRLAAGRVVILR